MTIGVIAAMGGGAQSFLSEALLPEITASIGDVGSIVSVYLGSNNVAVLFNDTTNSKTKCVVISDVNSAAPTVGAEIELEISLGGSLSIEALDATTIVAVYVLSSNVVMRTVSDILITPVVSGSTTISAITGDNRIAPIVRKIATDEVLVFYSTNGDLKLKKITSVTGTPSIGGEIAVDSTDTTQGAGFELMSATTGIICYNTSNLANAARQDYRIITNISTTPSVGSETNVDTLFSGSNRNVNTAKLEGDAMIFLNATSSTARYWIITDILTTPSVGSKNDVTGAFSGMSSNHHLTAMSGDTALFCAGISGTNGVKVAYLKDLLTTPTQDTASLIATTTSASPIASCVSIAPLRAAVLFDDTGGTEKMTLTRVK